MTKEEIRVGDVVVVRQFDDMLEEFGGDSRSAEVPFAFVEGMKPMCGHRYRVAKLKETSSGQGVKVIMEPIGGGPSPQGFKVSPEMLIPISGRAGRVYSIRKHKLNEENVSAA